MARSAAAQARIQVAKEAAREIDAYMNLYMRALTEYEHRRGALDTPAGQPTGKIRMASVPAFTPI